MDEIRELLNFNNTLVERTVSGGTTEGRITFDPPSTSSKKRDEYTNAQYGEEYVKENKQQMMKQFDDGVVGSDDECNDEMDNIYSTYNFKQPTSIYPITHYRNAILNAIKENSFVVLEGPTACGKTTQVPQFIIDEAYREKENCNIIIAQPRRIAAASNAERVAKERNWQVGTIIGYQVGLDEKKNRSSDTRMLFCTTGILLEKLIRGKNLHDYTHIILDEVHERSKDMDFLFVVLKKLFVSVVPKPKVKIIIMSATIEASRFSEYFSFPKRGFMEPAPIIRIERKSKYEIREFFMEEFYKIAPKIDYKYLDKTMPIIPVDLYKIALYLINQFDNMDKNELSEAGRSIEWPTVLVFLPGIHEIVQMDTVLRDHWNSVNRRRTRIEIIVLHSMSDPKQRSLAFCKAASNTRKIILATNIAESSITVPDVKYVLDFCRTRILVTDTQTNFSALQLTWAARSSCKQRAGRTGRVMDGRCYRFVEKKFYYNAMQENVVPELMSSPLESVILKAKLLDMGPPASILALALDRPLLNDIANTILVLKEIGAMLKTVNGEMDNMDGDISLIGRIMAALPIDVKIAKFIILGYCFSMLDECIIIGAALNSRSIFQNNYDATDNMRTYSQQLRWANSSGSDLIALLHVYKTWSHSHNSGIFGDKNTRAARESMKQAERAWAEKFSIDIDALHECHVQVNEIKMRLDRMHIKSGTGSNYVHWNDSEKAIILKVVISGGFYPNFFTRTTTNMDDYANESFHCIGSRDPRNTVYYTSFDRDHIRCLYTKPIKDIYIKNGIVPNEKSIRVNFDHGSNKTFVTFINGDHIYENGIESMPGKLSAGVYKAIKMRELHMPSTIWTMRSSAEELKYVKENGIPLSANGKFLKTANGIDIDTFIKTICLPRLLDVKMTGFITYIESCNRFWFQTEDEFNRVLEFETYVLNNRHKVIERTKSFVEKEMVIVSVDGCKRTTYHRAKILVAKGDVCQVRMIDSGKIHECKMDCIYKYCGGQRQFMDLPSRCFECCLAQLQPSQIRYPNGDWPIEAITLFKSKTESKIIDIEVYSWSSGKANVFVLLNTESRLNDILIQEQYGESVEEDYISNYNHVSRKSQMEMQYGEEKTNFADDMCEEYVKEENIMEFDPPPPEKCKKRITLKGPFSSLSIQPHGLTDAMRGKRILIDRNSINSVMLENDPQDMTEKYLVAATACYTDADRRHISLRYTTQMPNIRGFGPLMALIFCPSMHVTRNVEKTHYTALRTGLGFDSTKNCPLFQEHDMIFHLNVEITQHDIELVNQIRYCLDTLLLTYPGQNEPNQLNESTKSQILLKIKNIIVQLLERPRQSINKDYGNFQWDEHFTKSPDFVKSHANDIYGNRAIYPMHSTLKTTSHYDTNVQFMQIHCKQLHDLTKFMINLPKTVLCRLCDARLDNIAALQLHLVSGLHVTHEKRIGFQK